MTEEDKKYRQGRSFKQRESTYRCLEFVFAFFVIIVCAFCIYRVMKFNPYL